MIGNGFPISPFGVLPTMNIRDVKVVERITFSVRLRLTLAQSGVARLFWDPRAFTGRMIVMLPIAFDALGGPINVDLHKDAVSDDLTGTLVPIFNRDTHNGPAPSSIIRLDPNNPGDGPNPPIEYFIPSDGAGANVSAGNASDPLVAVIDHTVKSLLKITNLDAAQSATVGIKFDFFEVPLQT